MVPIDVVSNNKESSAVKRELTGVDAWPIASRRPAHGVAKAPPFNAQAFLDSAGVAKTIVQYGRGDTIFTQGDTCEHVMYIQTGGIKLSVLSKTGKEAVVAMLSPGDFFGEGCVAGQERR